MQTRQGVGVPVVAQSLPPPEAMKPNPAESKEDALRLATLVTHFQSNCMHEALGSVVNSIWEGWYCILPASIM